MPAFAIRARTVLVGVDDHQFRVARRMRRGGMQVQIAEATAEGQMLLRRQGVGRGRR